MTGGLGGLKPSAAMGGPSVTVEELHVNDSCVATDGEGEKDGQDLPDFEGDHEDFKVVVKGTKLLISREYLKWKIDDE